MPRSGRRPLAGASHAGGGRGAARSPRARGWRRPEGRGVPGARPRQPAGTRLLGHGVSRAAPPRPRPRPPAPHLGPSAPRPPAPRRRRSRAMPADLSGTWNLLSSDNFEGYMLALGRRGARPVSRAAVRLSRSLSRTPGGPPARPLIPRLPGPPVLLSPASPWPHVGLPPPVCPSVRHPAVPTPPPSRPPAPRAPSPGGLLGRRRCGGWRDPRGGLGRAGGFPRAGRPD